jgi:uncharacterized delta-60 repeat protein
MIVGPRRVAAHKSGLAFAVVLAALVASAPSLAAIGDLDPSFSKNGKVMTDFGGNNFASSVAIDAQGRLVVAGRSGGGAHFALARYTRDGSLDTSFSGNGKVRTDFGAYYAISVAIDSQNRIVVAGYGNAGGRFALARYKPNGSLDTSFSGDGLVRTAIGDYAWSRSVAIDPQDRVVVAGQSISRLPPGDLRGYDFALARYKPDGSLDGSFGADGKVTTDFSGGNDSAHSIAIDSQGRIVAAGFNGTPESELGDFALARYKPNGSPDPSFGTGGKVTTHIGGSASARSATIDSQGRIVAAGEAQHVLGSNDFALARYNPNGSLDTSFSGNGTVMTDFGNSDVANSVAIDSQGRIVAAGYKGDGFSFALARYKPNGRLDSSFGGDGRVRTHFKGGAGAYSVAIDSKSRIVAAGGASRAFALARYIG